MKKNRFTKTITGRSTISILLALLFVAAPIPSFHFRGTRAQEALSIATTGRIDPVELHQALLDLGNPFTVMCVAAHPDDEDGTTLTILRHKYGVHTVSLFSTYGEGGQNAVGPELYEELGVIRARETMAAAAIQGSEPHFLGLKDFGYSKSADEAFKFWGHDEALRRMVLELRRLRPDVIITNHSVTNNDHGHHQATARLELEAFDAAADPTRFPEQLKDGVNTWQVQRLFVRARSNPNQTETSGIVTFDPMERDPVRDQIFAEEALHALQQHATQGPWPRTLAEMTARFSGSAEGKLPLIRYRLTREAKGAAPLPPDPKTVQDGLRLPEAETAKLATPTIGGKALTDFTDQTDRLFEALIEARKKGAFSASDADDLQRFRFMNARFDHALALLSGVTLSLSSNDSVLVPNRTNSFTINLANNGHHPARVHRLTFAGWGEERPVQTADQLPAGTETTANTSRITPRSATFSVPESEHLYDGHLFGERFASSAMVEIRDARFSVTTEIGREVVPAVEIKNADPSPFVWTPRTRNRPLAFQLQIANHLPEQSAITLAIASPDRHFNSALNLNLGPNEKRDLLLEANAAPGYASSGRRRAHRNTDQVFLSVQGTSSKAIITQRPIPVVYADARLARDLRVGFIPSFDTTLEKALAALGVESTKVTASDIQKGDLKNYGTIVIDNRGYEAHPELIEVNAKLLDYVRDGGTLVVFYHKSNEWNPDPRRNRPQLAPYPIVLGNERVTDENAPVKFLRPRDPLLNFPNRITEADFKDWVQERGLYYPKEWDEHYVALLATNDPGEQPLNGGLLAASYGTGHYIYTSMVWYRQLRAGVPGGYRMFANMISYGHR
jgi:LmbE family N-acetylglucosaminyl deacetylase